MDSVEPNDGTSLHAMAERSISIYAHAARLLQLAGPIAIAQLSFIAMGVTDTVLLASLGPDALAAGGLANNFAMSGGIVLQGILQASSTLVAQAKGAGRQTVNIITTSLLLSLLLAAAQFLWLTSVPDIISALGEPKGITENVAAYVHISRWGAIGTLVGIGLMRALLPALGHGRVVLWTSVGATTFNGFLNYGLIHGAGPLPSMGLVGSAAATAVTLSCMTLVLAGLTFRDVFAPSFRLGHLRMAILKELLTIGLPIGGTYGVETLLFLSVGLMMGLLGSATLAAHQIVQNVAYICFMIPLAIGQAANIRVGYFAGKGDFVQAKRAGFVAIALGIACMTMTGLVMALIPQYLIGLYIARDRPDAGLVTSIAISIMMIAAIFQIADAVQTIAAGALRGLKDTRIPFLMAAIGYWAIGFVAATGLGIGAGLGAIGLWSGLAVGLGFVAVAMTWRFAKLSLSGTYQSG